MRTHENYHRRQSGLQMDWRMRTLKLVGLDGWEGINQANKIFKNNIDLSWNGWLLIKWWLVETFEISFDEWSSIFLIISVNWSTCAIISRSARLYECSQIRKANFQIYRNVDYDCTQLPVFGSKGLFTFFWPKLCWIASKRIKVVGHNDSSCRQSVKQMRSGFHNY